MNETSLSNYKKQKDKIEYLNQKYKDYLFRPIQYFRVKKWSTGDKKNGKYDWQYSATIKRQNGLHISITIFNNLEQLDERIEETINYIKEKVR